LDLCAGWRHQENLTRAATAMILTGILTGLLTGVAGFLAFLTVTAHTEKAHDLMYWHLAIQLASILIFAIVVWRRWQTVGPPTGTTRLFGVFASVLLLVGSYIGGTIVYQGGAGVNPQILSAEVREHSHGGNGHHSHSAEATQALQSDSLGP